MNGFKVQLLAGLMAAVFAGCTGESARPDVTELQQGLNVLDAEDAEWGMAAAYVKGERVVYFETRVGTLKPEIFRRVYAGDPIHEMDFRFVDANGVTFYSQRGGDFYVDPSWGEEINASREALEGMEIADMDANFAMAQQAIQSLETGLPAGFADHLFDARAILEEPLPSRNEQLKQDLAGAQTTEQDRAYFNWQWVNGGQWLDTHLYGGKVGCFAWICGYHTATRMYRGYPNLTEVVNACNHGRCWNELGYRCGSYGWTNGGWTTGENYSNTTAVNGGCATPYNWMSGGYDHLCNSDSSYEMWQAKSGSYATSQGDHYSFVWDNGGHNYACNCNNNNDCDGDWKYPGCP